MAIGRDHELVAHRYETDYEPDRIEASDSLAAINPSSTIAGSFIFNRLTLSRREPVQGVGKRRLDILMSLLILIAVSPVMLGVMLLIWLSSLGRDPVFYRQVRVGLKGKYFSVLKFRSMRMDAEKSGARMAARNDVRVTRIGRFIRNTRIDELPQLFNVLKGEMSLVGPRPERPEFVSEFERRIKGYSLRHQVKPGITGWAQVRYPYGETAEDAANKLYYDLNYIRSNSLLLDIVILFQTIPVVLTGHGAR
ncbi:MAG: exopolysaccharide biosynthesis polyprenyl glycosylphosphotransferase [Candidatus Thiodiazotropha sp. (ex Epidulcina cf. delphinae)]|nr:exopolysaccharide biosynthesis polyprenyl glycosylphosphotransferase [Candidatus Thiodiazotropha sp. (ex Epidulcina cf. delphinae)]